MGHWYVCLKDTQEMAADTLQERICEHTGGKVVDVPRACIMKDIREVTVGSLHQPLRAHREADRRRSCGTRHERDP